MVCREIVLGQSSLLSSSVATLCQSALTDYPTDAASRRRHVECNGPGRVDPKQETVQRWRLALEVAGVRFINHVQSLSNFPRTRSTRGAMAVGGSSRRGGKPLLSLTTSGFIGGGQIGYNHQIGNVVLGVEATLSGTDLNKDFHSILFPTINFSADINTIATVTGRVGVAEPIQRQRIRVAAGRLDLCTSPSGLA